MDYSAMRMFGPSAWSHVPTQELEEIEHFSPVAARHAGKLNDRMLAMFRVEIKDGITRGKFFLERDGFRYVCNFYRLSDYIKRATFESNHPLLHKYFGQLLPKVELASAVLTWRRRGLNEIPDFELVTQLFDGDDYREKKLLLSPLRSHVEQSIFAGFF